MSSRGSMLFLYELSSLARISIQSESLNWTIERCELLVGETEHPTVCLREYLRKADVLIGIESDLDEAEISIISGARAVEGIEDYRTAFFGTGFEEFEAGDFLVEETKREAALEQLRDWIQASWRLFAICHNEGEIERLRDVLRDNEVNIDAIRFVLGSLTRGFIYPEAKLAVLCDAEIFGRYQSPSARRLALRRSRLRGGRSPIDFAEIV